MPQRLNWMMKALHIQDVFVFVFSLFVVGGFFFCFSFVFPFFTRCEFGKATGKSTACEI